MNFSKINKPNINILNCCVLLAQEINNLDNIKQPIFELEEFESINDLPLLYYAQDIDKVVGFIGISLLSKTEIEICCFVSHKYRNKKIASQLLEMLFDDYSDFKINISLAPENTFGKYFLDSYNAKLESTECLMELNKSDYVFLSETVDLKETIDNNITLFDLEIDGKVIGFAQSYNDGSTFTIFAVEINKPYQGKGYGKVLLHSLLSSQFKNRDKAILHVTKENIPAFNLYSKLGFKIVEQLEYYSL